MKKLFKSKTFLGAVMSIALCVSLIAGATFAIFTSEAKVNIAVTSGTVKVTAEIGDLTTYSGVNITGTADDVLEPTAVNGTFTNGGTATKEGNSIVLDNVTPGDKVTFPITVTNYSNVKTKYQTIISVNGDAGLASALSFDIGGTTVVGASKWTALEAASAAGTVVKTVECSIALPSSVSDSQGVSCQVVNTVKAVQGNAETPVEVTRDALNASLTPDKIGTVEEGSTQHLPVEVELGDTQASAISYSENNSGYTGNGIMLGNTMLNKYAAAPANVGDYKFTFKNGTLTSAATGYQSVDSHADTSVYMLLPGNSDVIFENMIFEGVFSFDVQMYTSPWSYLNSITFKNCTFNGIIIGTCPAKKATFDGCTFNNYTNTTSANNSNPIWWRAGTGFWGQGADDSIHSLEEFTFVNNVVTSTRPVKIERIGWGVSANITFKNNRFDISKQEGDTATKNMAINIGQKDNASKFVLIDEGNTISDNTASLYTAALSGGSNQYIAVSGSKVLDGNGNPKTITAMVWKTTANETFEMKSID